MRREPQALAPGQVGHTAAVRWRHSLPRVLAAASAAAASSVHPQHQPRATPRTRQFTRNKADARLTYALKHVCMCHLQDLHLTVTLKKSSSTHRSSRVSAVQPMMPPVRNLPKWNHHGSIWGDGPSYFRTFMFTASQIFTSYIYKTGLCTTQCKWKVNYFKCTWMHSSIKYFSIGEHRKKWVFFAFLHNAPVLFYAYFPEFIA